jgi:tetratricopeptide (TPR) repeat protein
MKTSVACVLLAAVLAGSIASCSGDDAPDEERASLALTAALQAHQQGRLDEAAELYEEVLTLEPRNKFAWYNLGLIEQTRGDSAEAEERYREAIAVDPNFVAALFNLAVLRTADGDDEEAISLYRQVIGIDPSYAPAHLNLGFALIDIGQEREGETELQRATELDPSLASRIPDEIAAEAEAPTGEAGEAEPTSSP